jgi:hypothetical protein
MHLEAFGVQSASSWHKGGSSMKRAFVIVVAFGLLALGAQMVAAQQNPYVMLYFDDQYTVGSKDCPGMQPDSAYIVVKNFNIYLQAIEYQVLYPPEMAWIGDDCGDALVIGNTRDGIAESWPLPQNTYVPFAVAKVMFMWNCAGGCPVKNIPIIIGPHPQTFKLRYLSWPDLGEYTAIGMTSLICATIPVEETSWGKIKALYK